MVDDITVVVVDLKAPDAAPPWARRSLHLWDAHAAAGGEEEEEKWDDEDANEEDEWAPEGKSMLGAGAAGAAWEQCLGAAAAPSCSLPAVAASNVRLTVDMGAAGDTAAADCGTQ